MLRFTMVPILLLAILEMAPSPAVASTPGAQASVAGRVTDTDGAGLPGVVVSLLDAAQARAGQAVTDIEGNYRISGAPAGTGYLIQVAYPGFAAIEAGPLELTDGRTIVADLTLRTDAESTEVVRVEASGHTVDTDNPQTAAHLNREMIEGLPIIGHDYRDFLALASGVTDTDRDGNPNVHGSRETGVQYRLDGGNITDPVSGTAGQNLNPDIIEEIEFITAGASAEYGDADGGFANVVTKSGGNDFEGRFSIFWRGRLLDGQGPAVNDVNRYEQTLPEYHDLRPSLSLGGAIVRDRLWYFGSVQLLDIEVPVQQIGVSALRTARGSAAFGKLTWQADPLNKMTFQVSADPRTYLGNNLGVGVSPDSDFELIESTLVPQIKWTSTLSPRLLLEAQLSRFDSARAISAVSDLFEPIHTQIMPSSSRIGRSRALYPCPIINCDTSRAETGVYQIDRMVSQVTGPYFLELDARTLRTSLRTDISLTVEEAWGQHAIRSGFEIADEDYRDEPTANPVLFDYTKPMGGIAREGGAGPTGREVSGYQSLVVFQPLRAPRSAARLSSAFYLEDAWKPVPNLTVVAGARISHEQIDTMGFTLFDPREERRSAIGLWDAVCAEATAQRVGGACLNRMVGTPPQFPNRVLASFRDDDADGANDVDPRVAALDLNHDGLIEAAGRESQAMFADFTTPADRRTEGLGLANTNLSPRLRIAWDPWADGRTKLFGTWGRIPDRLFLDTIAGELGPDRTSFLFFPDASHRILPGAVSHAATAPTISQVDRNLRTPFKEELTLGFERELAPEWSLGLTYVRARYHDQLQDMDINHITCPQHDDVLGINPYEICGDAGSLEIDRFGSVDAGSVTAGGGRGSRPNGAPDLYILNDQFNQVLRLGNFNSTEYTAYELSLIKRLHRNWQMRLGYTWSEVYGQAESYDSPLGDDPETTDAEEAYLDHDQRHVLEFQAVTRLNHGISLGTVIQWASGTPYSVVAPVGDLDNGSNVNDRVFYPTGERNDQRNEGTWRIDLRAEKSFIIGGASASAFLNVENVLDSDDLTISRYSLLPQGGSLDAERSFRRFELGATISF